MSSLKITLILSAGISYRTAVISGKPHSVYAPTTLIHLAGMVPQELNATITLIDLYIDKLPEHFDADIVAISSITCAIDEAYRICTLARHQGITTILGGTHVTVMPEEGLQYADCVITGFAEKNWPKALYDFTCGKLQRLYSDNDSDKESFSIPALNRSLLKQKKYFFTDCIETTRGCPNGCAFCAIKPFSQNHIPRDLNETVNEISSMGKHLLFLDSNHTEFVKFNNQLWPRLKEMNKNWYCAGSMRFVSDVNRIRYASSCGLKGLLIGIESINQRSLDSSNKAFNNTGMFEDAIKRLHDFGISILGNFIFGFDSDDLSVFDSTVEFVIKNKIDIVRYAILTPLPGTGLYNKLKNENRLLTSDWSLYDTEHVVFKPKMMSAEQLQDGFIKAYNGTYSMMSILQRLNFNGISTLFTFGGNLSFRKISREMQSDVNK